MSKTVFNVGMKVYDEVNFPGIECIVISVGVVGGNYSYPILVKDINRRYSLSYTYDGRLYNGSIPTLSITPYTVDFKGFSQEEPLKKGQIVWVRDDENRKWMIAYFIEFGKGEYKYGVSAFNDKGSLCFWKFITTQNPYENED